MADLQAPDFETKVAILMRKAEIQGTLPAIPLPRDGVAGAFLGNRLQVVSGRIIPGGVGGPDTQSATSSHERVRGPGQVGREVSNRPELGLPCPAGRSVTRVWLRSCGFVGVVAAGTDVHEAIEFDH